MNEICILLIGVKVTVILVSNYGDYEFNKNNKLYYQTKKLNLTV